MLAEFVNIVNPTGAINLESESHDENDQLSRLNEYLKNQRPNDLNCADFIKFCEEILEFLNSKKAAQDVNALIVIQIFAKDLIHSIQFHFKESRYYYYYLVSIIALFYNINNF
jgi:hypothetical protein